MIKGKVFDKYGNELELDEGEPVPDGAVVQVPSRFMDRLDFMDDGTSMARLRRAYGVSDELRDAQERAQRAYNERSKRLSEAWRHPRPSASRQRRGQDQLDDDEVRSRSPETRIEAALASRERRLRNAWKMR